MTADRAEFVQALRDLADTLETNHGWPVPSYLSVQVDVDPSGVEAAASAMGVETYWNKERTHYSAVKGVGPITFKVLAITPEHMDEYAAELQEFREYRDQRKAGQS